MKRKRTATQLSVRCCYHGIALAYRGMFFFFFFFWGEGSRPRCLADLKARALRVEGSCFPVCILLIMLSHLFFLFLVTIFLFLFFFPSPTPPLLVQTEKWILCSAMDLHHSLHLAVAAVVVAHQNDQE